jgi:putative hemolysin
MNDILIRDAIDESDREKLAAGKHIVDILIEERATKLMRSPFWPLMKAVLYPLLKEPQARVMADAIAAMPGDQAMEHVSGLLGLDVVVSGLDHVPAKGRVLIASTHPSGIADGLAMYDALKKKRPDVVFFANRDAMRVSPGLRDLIIPVEWVEAKRTRQRSRETLIETKRAFEEERCVVIFPSGRLAMMGADKQLIERPWMNSAAIFARKYECPIVPTNIGSRNSPLYYLFWRINTELRDITLFNELLNKRGKRFDIAFGAPAPPEALGDDPALATARLREHASHGVRAGAAFAPLAPSRP